MSSILAEQTIAHSFIIHLNGGWGGGDGAVFKPMSTVLLCTWSPDELLRSNSIFNLCHR
jgi:hypothetical protein